MGIKQSYEVDPKGHFLRYAWFENPHVRQYTTVFSSAQALKFRLWESASFHLICSLDPDNLRIVWNVVSIRVGLARVPIEFRRGSLIPHSPFGGGMRATQNSKLSTENHCRNWTEHIRFYLSCNRLWHLYFAHTSTEEQVKTLTLLLWL